jgi:DHA1 family bicyclomycin/chloramphenicol resistance-like MFS transporter
MEKLITTALVSFLVVSATYIALFYNTPIRCSCFVVVFCNAIFQYRFSFGNLRAMAMEPGTHCGIAAAVTGFISTIMAVPISIFIGRFIADRALPLFVGFSICATLSVGLLIYLK